MANKPYNYEDEDDEDFDLSQYRVLKSRIPKKEKRNTAQRYDWDDD